MFSTLSLLDLIHEFQAAGTKNLLAHNEVGYTG